MKNRQRLRHLTTQVLHVCSLAVLLTGIALAGVAGIQWLQTAAWHPLTVRGALDAWPSTREWVTHPRAWLGLHRLIVWTFRVPLFMIVTLAGLALVFASRPSPPPAVKTYTPWSTR